MQSTYAAKAYQTQKKYSAGKELLVTGGVNGTNGVNGAIGINGTNGINGTSPVTSSVPTGITTFSTSGGATAGGQATPANAPANTPTNAYLSQKVMTSAQEDLPTLLYGGAVRFINLSINAIEQGNVPDANMYNMRAQDIVRELMVTLDMQVEMSKGLMELYDYIHYRLIQANIKKDKDQLIEARGFLQDLRDTWAEAVKIYRKDRGGANDGSA